MSDREIAELQRQLQNLTIEFRRRTNEINTQLAIIRTRQEHQQQRATEDRQRLDEDSDNDSDDEQCGGFVKGNIVRITNNYKGCYGIVGEVKFWNSKKNRITIVDKTGKPYVRAPWNLELVDP